MQGRDRFPIEIIAVAAVRSQATLTAAKRHVIRSSPEDSPAKGGRPSARNGTDRRTLGEWSAPACYPGLPGAVALTPRSDSRPAPPYARSSSRKVDSIPADPPLARAYRCRTARCPSRTRALSRRGALTDASVTSPPPGALQLADGRSSMPCAASSPDTPSAVRPPAVPEARWNASGSGEPPTGVSTAKPASTARPRSELSSSWWRARRSKKLASAAGKSPLPGS